MMLAVVVALALALSGRGTSAAKECIHDDSYAFKSNLLNGGQIICGSVAGHVMLLGDFDGDGRDDWFCNAEDKSLIDYFSLTEVGGMLSTKTPARTKGWCDGAEGQLLTGDFNGDGCDELLCRFKTGQKYEISLFKGSKFVGRTGLASHIVCPDATHRFLIGDVTGDRADDFVCIEKTSGTIEVDVDVQYGRPKYYGKKYGRKAYPEMPVSTFCTGSNKQVFLGDLNGDYKQDLICFDSSLNGGTVQGALSDGYGRFKTVMHDLVVSFCGNPITDSFRVADLNGDGYTDLLCIIDAASAPTQEKIAYGDKTQGYVQQLTLNDGPSCGKADKILFGDLNGNRRADMVCDYIIPNSIAHGLIVNYSVCFPPPL